MPRKQKNLQNVNFENLFSPKLTFRSYIIFKKQYIFKNSDKNKFPENAIFLRSMRHIYGCIRKEIIVTKSNPISKHLDIKQNQAQLVIKLY